MPDTLDFVIVCYGRSGSHLLADLLSSHPDVSFCHDKHMRSSKDIERFDAGSFVRSPETFMCGTVVHYSAWDYFASVANIQTTQFIHLIRDLETVALSVQRYKRMKAAGVNAELYRQNDSVPTGWNVSVPPQLLARQKDHIRQLVRKFSQILEPYHPLICRYESLTEGRNITEVENDQSRSVLRFLGLEEQRLRTTVAQGISQFD